MEELIVRKYYFIIVVCACALFSLYATQEETHEFKGDHYIASYCECDTDALTNLKALEQAMLVAAAKSGAMVLKSASHEFPGNGFTMVILLSESHASIHTYPELGACFVDLFTCGDKCHSEYFDQALRAYLKPKKVNERNLIRTTEIQDKTCSLKTDKMQEDSSLRAY